MAAFEFRHVARALVAAAALFASGAVASAGCIEAYLSGLKEYAAGQSTRRSDFKVNELFVICLTAARSGQLSIYDAPPHGAYERLYPNRFTHPANTNSAPIEAGKQYCFGDPGAPGNFPMFMDAADGFGKGKISIQLTDSAADQLTNEDFDVPGEKVSRGRMSLHLQSYDDSHCTSRNVDYLNYTVSE